MSSPTAAPWQGRALFGLSARTLVGLGAVVAGWHQASQKVLLADQAPWLALAIAGVGFSAAAGAFWLLEYRLAVSLRLRDVKARLAALRSPSVAVIGDDGELVAVEAAGARLFHDPTCQLVQGREFLLYGDVDAHAAEGRRACEVCLS